MMTDDEPKTIRKRLGVRPVRITVALIVAVALSACGAVAIGPVDHECHSNPAQSQGSGCDRRRFVESHGHLDAGHYLDLPQFDDKATAVYAETMDVKYAKRD